MPKTQTVFFPTLTVTPHLASTAKPFVKWAGGKSQLLDQYEKLFPQNFDNYIEPMVGGGAVFFYLSHTDRIQNKVSLIDNNPELMNCYQLIKENVKALVLELKHLEEECHRTPKEFFYQVRSWDRKDSFVLLPAAQRAARTIFLNKTCYNGLYRVNSKGHFNVPFGKYKNPKICDEENLRTVSASLQNVNLITGDFEKCLEIARQGDFVYFDPPYYPVSETASFTSYTKEDFGRADQVRLRDTFIKLTNKGCKVMLSNSDTKFIHDLYRDLNIYKVYARRYINSDPRHRGEITELVITNY